MVTKHRVAGVKSAKRAIVIVFYFPFNITVSVAIIWKLVKIACKLFILVAFIQIARCMSKWCSFFLLLCCLSIFRLQSCTNFSTFPLRTVCRPACFPCMFSRAFLFIGKTIQRNKSMGVAWHNKATMVWFFLSIDSSFQWVLLESQCFG